MSAKSDIIQTMHGHARAQQIEMEQLRRELHSKGLEASALICENFTLKERVLLQHSSWQLLEGGYKNEIAKLRNEIKHLDLCLDAKAVAVFNLSEKINSLNITVGRIRGWNFFQALIAKLFRL